MLLTDQERSVAALVLFTLYMLGAFVLRTWTHRRATGSSGFHGISGRAGSWSWWGGVSFVGALLVGVMAPALALLGCASPVDTPVGLGRLGALLVLASIAATIWSQHAMGTAWRIGVRDGERTRLVRHGPFAFVRNPIFTFMTTAALGFGLLVPNVPALAFIVLLVTAVEIQVRCVEEPHLLRTHGEPYAAYMREVGRFVPGLGRHE